jgi:hypothetical protein
MKITLHVEKIVFLVLKKTLSLFNYLKTYETITAHRGLQISEAISVTKRSQRLSAVRKHFLEYALQ